MTEFFVSFQATGKVTDKNIIDKKLFLNRERAIPNAQVASVPRKEA